MLSYNAMKIEAIIGMIMPPISMAASLTIIILISKSSKKFTTVLNRLLLGLCISDIFSSIAEGLVSFPMPSDTKNAWMAIGNTATCDAQGFVVVSAAIVTPSYNAGICLISWLKIKYNNRVAITKIEPFLHIIPISLAFAVSFYSVMRGYINPEFGTCFLSDKPEGCSSSEDDSSSSCERGDGVYQDGAVIFFFVLTFGIIPSLIIGSMVDLYLTVKKQEDRMAKYGIGSLTSLSKKQRKPKNSRYINKVMYRAIAYSTAWFIPFIFPFIGFFQMVILDQRPSPTLRILDLLFFPLQGFCNFIVFIYPKMLDIKVLHPEYSLLQLLTTACSSYDTSPRRDNDVVIPQAARNRPSGVAVVSLSAPVFQERTPPLALPDGGGLSKPAPDNNLASSTNGNVADEEEQLQLVTESPNSSNEDAD
jgi:hypothetical protein